MLKITSFNCRGFKSSVEDIKALFRRSDVLAIQEHWLNPAEFGLINQVDVDVCFSAVSPMEKNRFYSGRPFGGVALLWRKHIHEMVPINSGSDIIAAAVVSHGGKRLLIVTAYMPVDYGDHKSFGDFMDQLGDLDGIMSSVSFNSCICIGDFNTDLRKARFSRRNRRVQRGMSVGAGSPECVKHVSIKGIYEWDLYL